jgi:hypothetical protein
MGLAASIRKYPWRTTSARPPGDPMKHNLHLLNLPPGRLRMPIPASRV